MSIVTPWPNVSEDRTSRDQGTRRCTPANRCLVRTLMPRDRDDRYYVRQVSTLAVASDRLAVLYGELRFRLPDEPPIHEARREHEPISSGTYTGRVCQSSKGFC
nr:hypothetical protein GCM10020063_082270 [Dactylosporangium thailandense]